MAKSTTKAAPKKVAEEDSKVEDITVAELKADAQKLTDKLITYSRQQEKKGKSGVRYLRIGQNLDKVNRHRLI